VTTATETETVHGATEHAAEAAYNPGSDIMHHIQDGKDLWGMDLGEKFPEIVLFGQDFSITRHVIMMWIAAGFLLLVFSWAARKSKEPVPKGTRNVLEIFMLFIRDEVARKAMGPAGDRFVGYLMTTFFFILTCNLLGLVPFMSTATGNISVTAALALIAFGVIQGAGIKEFGLVGHYKNLVPSGIPMWLLPIMIPIEFLGMLIKPFALAIRLFANMMAGHVVILALISLIFILKDVWYVAAPFAVAFTLFMNLLELLVAALQAYIFTMLTAQFIGMSVHPAH
jgi:F-type H+-transporting ATPase subunit a